MLQCKQQCVEECMTVNIFLDCLIREKSKLLFNISVAKKKECLDILHQNYLLLKNNIISLTNG